MGDRLFCGWPAGLAGGHGWPVIGGMWPVAGRGRMAGCGRWPDVAVWPEVAGRMWPDGHFSGWPDVAGWPEVAGGWR